MNAPKLQELLLLLLSVSVSAAGESATAQKQAECSGQEIEETLYVGVYIFTDSVFRACSSYKGDVLEDYLKAFVGGVAMRFWGLRSPAVKVVFHGSRPLTDQEERDIVGNGRDERHSPVKGADAVKKLLSIEVDGETVYGKNIFYYLLTGRNITEEATKAIINTEATIPGGDSDYDEYSDETSTEKKRTVDARSNPTKEKFRSVGGLSQYGTICTASVGIGYDNGRNFSGVEVAAQQVANILGPVYHGNISTRICDDYQDAETEFHNSECYMRKNYGQKDEDKYECLKDALEKSESEIKNPQRFFDKHKGWSPCGQSFPGTEECKSEETAQASSPECHLSCCPQAKALRLFIKTPYDVIPAPDGKNCRSQKVCVAGDCVTAEATTKNK
uniref:Putative metalloprotease n=1 Tax=Ixodes ricinus TaxID=34613 RepID=A0A0K8RJB7_IXORI